MNRNSLPTGTTASVEPSNLDYNSQVFHQLISVRDRCANDKENLEDAISASPRDCEGYADATGDQVNVPSDENFSGELTPEQEPLKSYRKSKSEQNMQRSDSLTTQVDFAFQDRDAYTGSDEALVKTSIERYSDSPVQNSNNNLPSPKDVDYEYSVNAKLLLNDNCDRNIAPLNVESQNSSTIEVPINNNSDRFQTKSLSASKVNSLSSSNSCDESKVSSSKGNDGCLFTDKKCKDTTETFAECNSAEAKTSEKDEACDARESANDFDVALIVDENHFAENSDDEKKGEPEEKIAIAELSDVGRYSYACLVAHSLHTLFGYSSSNRKFQDNCLKQIIRRLGQSKQMRETLMMVVRGDVSLGGSDPLVDSLKSQFANPKLGSLLIIADLLEMSLREGIYDARMRTVLKFMSLVLGVLPEEIEDLEDAVQEKFREDDHLPTEEEKKEKLAKMKSRRIRRIALVSVAAIGGGALIGLTAGIAAPLIAIGAGAVIGGVGAAGLGTVAGAAIIGSIFGVAGAGLTGFKMKKRIGELEEFEFEPLTEGRSLHVTVAVSGWLNDKHTDFRSVWLGLAHSREQYILRYESKYMRELGQAMDYIANIAITAAVKHTLKQTLLSGLLAAISWPLTLLSVASIIDNPWSICTQRSTNAGRQLAEVLLSRQQGRRPVTLIGFSFGARVIFYCLEELASRKNAEDIVEDVILLGAPVSGCVEDWSRFEKVVAGRIVNGYCRGDWLLKFMYRTASVQMTIAGLDAVKWENRRMHNIDLTDIVSGHLDYFNQIDRILNAIGVRTVEHVTVGSAESLKQWTSLRRSDQSAADKPSKAEEEILTGEKLPVNEDLVTETGVEAKEEDVAPLLPVKDADKKLD